MCRVMEDLDKHIQSIEKKHNIKLTKSEIKNLKKLLCKYSCAGRCLTSYRIPIQ